MGSISMYSEKTAWRGRLDWSYASGYVSVTMVTWKTDSYPSSAASGANFTARITLGTKTETFTFQQQEIGAMTVGVVSGYVSGNQVYIGGQVDAPYGVSMYGYPLSGGETVTLYEEPEETTQPSRLRLSESSVKMGDTLTISLERDNGLCLHNLYYLIAGGQAVSIGQGVGLSKVWPVPDLSAYCLDTGSVTVTIRCDTYEGDSYIGRTLATVTVLLPDATRPQASGGTMGAGLTITLDRKAEAFTHNLSWEFAGAAGEITAGAGAAYTWQVPLSLAKEIPLLTKGTCTLVCRTFCGSYPVGEETVTCQLTVPDNEETKPTGTMTLTPTGDLGEAFAGMFLRGRTGIRADFTGNSEYSRVERFELAAEGITTAGNPAQSLYLNSHGALTVTGRIIDARGYVRELKQTISVIAYDKPRVVPYQGETAITAVRCDPDGLRNPQGQSLLLKAGRKYTALKEGTGQLNFCSLLCRWKAAGAAEFGPWETLLSGEALETDQLERVIPNAVPDLKTPYTVQLRVEDTLGSVSSLTVSLGALGLPLHLGRGNGSVAVGKYCDPSRSDAFEIGLTTYFEKGIAPRPIFTGGSWEPGCDLGAAAPAPDTAAVSLYTVFLAICEGQPVLLLKYAAKLWGQGIQITLEDPVTLQQAPGAVTELYALL